MKERCNRAILFAKIDDEKENLLTFISVTEHTLALSDEQIQYIDEKLLVHSLAEFEDKFEMCDMTYERENIQNAEPLEHVADYYDTLTKENKKKEYRCWYYDIEKQKKEMTKGKQIPVKLYEVWLGVKSFFEQGENLELLITNLSYEELESETAQKKLSLYMETVNDKQENSYRIGLAILPEIPMLCEYQKLERIRFEGWVHEKETCYIGNIGNVLRILQKNQVTGCYQYETGEVSSAKMFAAEGREKVRENAMQLQQQTGCNDMACCYPNLTWIADKVYIGAAYVVTGVLLAGGGEKSETTLPRELYPYKEEIKKEIWNQPFGAMLAYETQVGKRNMVLFSARSQKWSKGEYIRIDGEDMDV